MSSSDTGVDLLLLWHMHQPDYRDRSTGEFTMPWVYLHALKDYSDMAWHLEQHPAMRVVVNFVPVLLDQLEDYEDQFTRGTLRDPLLRLLVQPDDAPLSEAERRHILDQCFRANHTRLIAPFAPYKRLHDIFTTLEAQGANSLLYLADRYYLDLVTWYHLSWTGETVRRSSERLGRLMAQGERYSLQDRRALLAIIAREVQQVVPRYRALAQRGQIELSTTPHCHPLAPLMLDFASARDALPDIALPASTHYPDGRARVDFHIDSALASHTRRFGSAPRGVWPAEGALSAAFAGQLAQRSIGWTASSEGVLGNSLHASRDRAGANAEQAAGAAPSLHQPYQLQGLEPPLVFFFRDDRLSDLIGFSYSKWHGRDAALHFVHEIETIGQRAQGQARPLVCVMLDGENAWEYYPYNGYFFLSDLYQGLSTNPHIRLRTGADVVDDLAGGTRRAGLLPVLAAGSWVYGNFATWIGAADKNTAWDLLCAAKQCYDEVLTGGTLDRARQEQAAAQLADCEASDWFWWPGEDNPGTSVSAFETLFRSKLGNLYHLLGRPVPDTLRHAFSRGAQGEGSAEIGGTMRRGVA